MGACFFKDTATSDIYTLSLHDALPIWRPAEGTSWWRAVACGWAWSTSPGPCSSKPPAPRSPRSEEHTSELQSRQYFVCRLLLVHKIIRLTHPFSAYITCIDDLMQVHKS